LKKTSSFHQSTKMLSTQKTSLRSKILTLQPSKLRKKLRRIKPKEKAASNLKKKKQRETRMPRKNSTSKQWLFQLERTPRFSLQKSTLNSPRSERLNLFMKKNKRKKRLKILPMLLTKKSERCKKRNIDLSLT